MSLPLSAKAYLSARRRGWIILISIAFPLALVGFCSTNKEKAPSAAPNPHTSPAVELLEIKPTVLARKVTGQGTIAAFRRSAIGALVQGPMDQIFVRVGDRVVKGQPLFRTRQTDYQRRLDEALAAVRLAKAEAEQAERTNDRLQALKPRGFVSHAKVEEAETSLTVARARVAQGEAVAATARQALNDTTVRAPYNAVITARNVDEGVYLSTFGVGGQSAVLEIQEVETVAAIVHVAQDQLGQIRRDQPASLYIEGFATPFKSFVGVINDRVDVQARTVEVRLPIRNASYEIKPGLSVRAEIEVPAAPGVVIPRLAVAGDSAAYFVFVADEGVARTRPVNLRPLDLERVEVVSGLSAGDRIVLNPSSNLADGTRLTMRQASTAKGNGSDVAR